MMLYYNTKAKARWWKHILLWYCRWSFTRIYIITIFFYNLHRLRLRASRDLRIENSFTLKRARSRRYLAEFITDADYANNQVRLANTLAQAESMLYSLEQAVGGIGLHVNEKKPKKKPEYMCFKREGAISTLSGEPLKLVDTFTYLGCSVSSTESDVNICLAKAWTAIDRLSILWKSDPPDEIKRDFFQIVAELVQLYGCTTWITKRTEKKLDGGTTKECCLLS